MSFWSVGVASSISLNARRFFELLPPGADALRMTFPAKVGFPAGLLQVRPKSRFYREDVILSVNLA